MVTYFPTTHENVEFSFTMKTTYNITLEGNRPEAPFHCVWAKINLTVHDDKHRWKTVLICPVADWISRSEQREVVRSFITNNIPFPAKLTNKTIRPMLDFARKNYDIVKNFKAQY